MRAVEHGHIAIGRPAVVQGLHLRGHPCGLVRRAARVVQTDRRAVRQGGEQGFFHAVRVSGDERIGHGQDLRRGAVIFHHQDRPRTGKDLIEVQQIPDVCSAPGIDRLVGIAYDEEVVVIAAQHLHQRVLRLIDVLKFVDHDVFQPLLPLEPDVRILLEDIEREFQQIVVVQPKAFLLLVEIAIENDVVRGLSLQIFLLQRLERQRDEIEIILRLLLELAELDHVPRRAEGHGAQRQPALLVDDAEHGVDVAVVKHEKAPRILHGVAVLLQDGHTEAVERADIARVLVARQGVDALAHFGGGLVRERHAQDVAGQRADLVHKVGKAPRQCARLAGARACNHADIALRGRDGLPLCRVQPAQQIVHALSPPFPKNNSTKSGEIQARAGRACALPANMLQ